MAKQTNYVCNKCSQLAKNDEENDFIQDFGLCYACDKTMIELHECAFDGDIIN